MKIVINICFGGFTLSDEACHLYKQYSGKECSLGVERNDPHLVRVVEELKSRANGDYAALRIVEIPDDVKWHIHEYDGCETVHENHRSWPGGEDC